MNDVTSRNAHRREHLIIDHIEYVGQFLESLALSHIWWHHKHQGESLYNGESKWAVSVTAQVETIAP